MTKYKDEKKKKTNKKEGKKKLWDKESKWEKKDFIGPYLIRLLTVWVISRIRIKKKTILQNNRYRKMK